MNATVLRKKLRGYVVEPANAEERALIEKGMAHFYKHPEDFISLDDLMAHGADYVPPDPEKQDWWPKTAEPALTR
jgi:hypothetical protein